MSVQVGCPKVSKGFSRSVVPWQDTIMPQLGERFTHWIDLAGLLQFDFWKHHHDVNELIPHQLVRRVLVLTIRGFLILIRFYKALFDRFHRDVCFENIDPLTELNEFIYVQTWLPWNRREIRENVFDWLVVVLQIPVDYFELKVCL